ncbi:MAG: hypothetical protein HOK72_13000, partial [Flavobacteriales bacterium]|nr:hypothetical protein [Flavobacteriales bacterium]
MKCKNLLQRIFVFLAVLSCASYSHGMGVITSDDPCGAQNLAVNAACSYTYMDGNAMTASGVADPGGGCGMGFANWDPDAWFQITVPPSGSVIVTASDGQGSTITDGIMMIYSGTCTALTLIDCNDDANGGSMPEISLTGQTPGATLWVRFLDYDFSVNWGVGTFEICASEPPLCAFDIAVNNTTYSASLTTCGFGDDFTSTSTACASSYLNGDDIVIEWTPTTTECVNIALSNTLTWTGFFITDGCPDDPATNCLASATASGGNPSFNNFNVTAGTTYYLTVSTFAAPQCTPFDIDIIACPPPPPNDDPCGAIAMTVNPTENCVAVTPSYTSSATNSGLSTCGFGSDDDVWFSFVATSTAHNFEILNIVGSTDMEIQVFNGTCGAPVSQFCSTANSINMQGLTIGDTYYVSVWTFAVGVFANSFDACVTVDEPCLNAVGNNAICGAAEPFCTGDVLTYCNNTNVGSIGAPGCLGSAPNPGFFYMNMSAPGDVTLEIEQVSDAGNLIDV